MDHESFCRHPGRKGDQGFPFGGHVDADALLMGQPGHRQAEERLGGVGGCHRRRRHGLTTALPKVALVVDEERRAELRGQVEGVAPGDRQAAVATDGGVVGKQAPAART